MKKKKLHWSIIIAVGLAIAMIPVPEFEGLEPTAFRLLGIFIATILCFILQPVPMGTAALLSVTILVFTKVAPMSGVLTGFSSSVTWLVAMAFFLARGFEKTGLGRRISLMIVRAIGDNSLKLGYAVCLSDLVFGPAIPSFTSRSAGIVFPVINGLCDVYDSHPGPTANKIGAYLMQLEHQATVIVGAMFLTGSTINPLGVNYTADNAGYSISWLGWAKANALPGLICLLLLPLVLNFLMRPTIKKTPEAPRMAVEELKKMGSVTKGEKVQLVVFIACVTAWCTSLWTGLDATAIAFAAVAVLLVTSTITWKDCLQVTGAWDVIVWIGVLITLSGMLTKYGIISWFSSLVGPLMQGKSWIMVYLILAAIYLWSHYMFASVTSHISSLFAPLLVLMLAAGTPPAVAAFTLGGFSTMCGALTHYSAGHSPVFYGAGYVNQPTWWKTGFLCSAVNYVVFIGFGLLWWKLIGLY